MFTPQLPCLLNGIDHTDLEFPKRFETPVILDSNWLAKVPFTGDFPHMAHLPSTLLTPPNKPDLHLRASGDYN